MRVSWFLRDAIKTGICLSIICLSAALSVVLSVACAGKKAEERPIPATADLPYGAWQVVDLRGNTMGDWTAILTLDRFTYSWTTFVPSREAIFYEAGDVAYDTNERRIQFMVKTAKAMDRRSGIPREMIDDPRKAELRHAPGDQYRMTWGVGKDVLRLTGPATEITYLRRLKAGPADSSIIDVQRGR